MKPIFRLRALVAAFVLLSPPAATFAQKEKNKTKEDVQQIIITRKGDKKDKTVIEIKGDKVLVNGKDVSKDGNVTVNLSNLSDINEIQLRALSAQDRARAVQLRALRDHNNNFNFDFNNGLDDDAVSLFSEDANRAMLGVTTDEDDEGAKITTVSKESAAAKAGLKEGDVITKIGDDAIEDSDDVSKAVRKHKPGDKITVTFLRDGTEQKLTAELGRWKGVRINNLNATIAPVEPFEPAQPFNDFIYRSGSTPKLGLTVQDTDDGNGVKVLNVADDSNAAKAGVKQDDIITQINDEKISSTDDVVQTLRQARTQPNMKLKLLRDGKEQTLDVRTPRKLKTTNL